MSSTNSLRPAETSAKDRSPKADKNRCGMGNVHGKSRSGEVKLSRTQRKRLMRQTATALRLGHIAIQAHISRPLSPTRRFSPIAHVGGTASTRINTHSKGGTHDK